MTHFTLHEDIISGNCYKIRLTAALLSIPLERKGYSILNGETRTPEFLERVSSHGRIPVLQIGDSTFLAESNAACFYLADTANASGQGSSGHPPLIPKDPLQRAEMLRWMFFEQNFHEVNIATLRYWLKIIGAENLGEERLSQVDAKKKAGRVVLDQMNDHLNKSEHGWFVGNEISLADIALFAYTHVADEGGFDTKEWPAVQEWLQKVQGVKQFVSMEQ